MTLIIHAILVKQSNMNLVYSQMFILEKIIDSE